MKLLILAFCIACASAASLDQDKAAEILRSDFEQSPDGGFQYAYETNNGIAGQVSGSLKQIGKDEVAVVQTGSNQFKSPEGEVFQLTFVADENGYQPQGAHLPTPPPTVPYPEHVVRTLQYIAAHPYIEPK